MLSFLDWSWLRVLLVHAMNAMKVFLNVYDGISDRLQFKRKLEVSAYYSANKVTLKLDDQEPIRVNLDELLYAISFKPETKDK